MSSLNRSVVLAALMGLVAPSVHMPAFTVAAPYRTQREQRRESGGPSLGNRFGYKNGPGWSAAKVKRMAKKARNRNRHKIACRGAKHV